MGYNSFQFSTAAHTAPKAGRRFMSTLVEEALTEPQFVDQAITLITQLLCRGIALPRAPISPLVISAWAPQPFPLPGDGNIKGGTVDSLAEEILLTGMPLPSTPPEGLLTSWLQRMTAREPGDADEMLKRYAGLDIDRHATALERERLYDPKGFADLIDLKINSTGSLPHHYELIAAHAKIKATQLARLRGVLVQLLHKTPLPHWMRMLDNWQKSADVHKDLLVGGSRALHALLGAKQKQGERIEAFLDRATRRALLSPSASARLLRMARAINAARTVNWEAFGSDEQIAAHLSAEVLKESWALAAYKRANDDAPIPFDATFVHQRLEVSPKHAIVLIAMNLIAAWRWIDDWRDAKISGTSLIANSPEALMPRKRSSSTERALYEITDFLRCDGRTDRHALRQAEYDGGKQSKNIVVSARKTFNLEFPRMAQSRLGIAPWLWLPA